MCQMKKQTGQGKLYMIRNCFFFFTLNLPVMKMEFSPTPLPRQPLICSSFHSVFAMPGETNSNSFCKCCKKICTKTDTNTETRKVDTH